METLENITWKYLGKLVKSGLVNISMEKISYSRISIIWRRGVAAHAPVALFPYFSNWVLALLVWKYLEGIRHNNII